MDAQGGLRIALVTPVLWPYVLSGGINAYVATLASELAVLGHHVTVVGREIHAHPVATETRYEEPFGESVSVVPPALPWPAGERFANLRAAIAVHRHLRRHARTYDVVETTNWLGHGAFCAGTGIPYVARVSTPAYEYLDHSFGVRHLNWLEGRTCRRADRIVGHSRAILEKVLPLYAVRHARDRVIPLGIPDVPLSGAARAGDAIDFLCVGRAEDRKGTDVLLRALRTAFARSPAMRLTFVGSDVAAYVRGRPELATLWQDLRARYGDRIRELGTVDDERKLAEYERAHYVLVPSRFESFGLVVPEAMRAGTPVIAAAGGSLADVCGYGPANTVYDDPESDERLAEAMLAADRRGVADAEAHCDATRDAFERNFTVARFVAASVECYRDAIASRRDRTLTIASATTSRYRLAKR